MKQIFSKRSDFATFIYSNNSLEKQKAAKSFTCLRLAWFSLV